VALALPGGLAWWAGEPGGAAWLRALPGLVEACAERWNLRLEAPVEPAMASLVIPAGDAVLKLNPPEPESEHEGAALAHWAGVGAARLLAQDPERHALLVERCRPGTALWQEPDEDAANEAAVSVLAALWRPPAPAHPFRTLADAAAEWAQTLPRRWAALGRPCPRPVLERGLTQLREPQAGPPVVLHQDLHGGNVLRATRAAWLAIDPKPLVGEPAFDLASLLRDRRPELLRDPAPLRRVRRRLDLLAAATGLDRERVRGWAVAHALAWGIEANRVHADLMACAEWLARA
jgi:streptomycin 6-kinase